jgi:hypothetical protein
MCEYYVPGTDPTNDRQKPICRAFPEGIPREIMDAGFDHRQPFEGETILFKPAAGVTEADINQWEAEVLENSKADVLGVLGDMEPEQA